MSQDRDPLHVERDALRAENEKLRAVCASRGIAVEPALRAVAAHPAPPATAILERALEVSYWDEPAYEVIRAMRDNIRAAISALQRAAGGGE